MYLNSPLEQFSIFSVFPIVIGIIDLSVTNVSIIFFIVSSIFFASVIFSFKTFYLFSGSIFQTILEFFYDFVNGIMFQQTTYRNIPYTALALTVFIFIFVFNFCGVSTLIPTLTSQLVITAGLAFSLNFGFLLLAFQVQGIKFLKFFVPSGIPIFLVPFMTVIELFSYSLRSVSLFVRLFANMMAGHTLMHIISSFFLIMFLSFNYYISFFPLVLLISIYILELAIAFLQAYVFLTLFCIYLNDAINTH